VLGDWRAGGAQLERHTAEFAGRYAAQDPAYRAFARAAGAVCLTTCVAREELPHPGHRRLMEEAGFVSRVATLFPGFALHVLRSREHGELSGRALARFAHAAPVLGSLISRHLRWSSPQARLLALCPALTPREAAVCGGLLAGAASREIAARLGIGIASVQTYRKRAYRKLGVGSLPELFSRLLGHASDPDPR
jgi:DNA-binding CsgD family transcriptional regulator